MLNSCYCDFNDACILVKETISVANAGSTANPNNSVKSVIFKNYTPFTDCIEETDNNKVDNANDIDIVAMPMYRSIRYSDNYPKIS